VGAGGGGYGGWGRGGGTGERVIAGWGVKWARIEGGCGGGEEDKEYEGRGEGGPSGWETGRGGGR